MVFVLLIIILERLLRGRAKFHAHRSSKKNLSIKTRTKFGSFVAFSCCGLLFLFSFVLPIANLTINTFRGWGKSNLINIIQGPLVDSFLVSLIGCLGIVVAALVVSYASRLFPSFFMKTLSKLCMLGYAVPGAVVAISILIYFSGMGKYLGFTTLTSFMFTLSLLQD